MHFLCWRVGRPLYLYTACDVCRILETKWNRNLLAHISMLSDHNMLLICLTQDISVNQAVIPLRLILILWDMPEMSAEIWTHTFCSHCGHWLCSDFVTHMIHNPKAKYQLPHWHHIVSFFSELHMDVCYNGRCRRWLLMNNGGISILPTSRKASFSGLVL